MHVAKLFEAANDERFKQNQGHLLGQTALAKFKLGTDDNNRTSRVIDTLAQ